MALPEPRPPASAAAGTPPSTGTPPVSDSTAPRPVAGAGAGAAGAAGAGAGPRPAGRSGDRYLRLEDILKLMMADGLVAGIDANSLQSRRLRYEHPLQLIAEQQWRSLRPPRKLLTLDVLTEWLAGRLGVPYVHIDPLRINFAAVTATMSNAYAERYRILPVAVQGSDLTVATAEPFAVSWAPELEQALRVKVKVVLANPHDIRRYLSEFYNLAKSIKKASDQRLGDNPIARNFEQLVELGQSGTLDANDQHIVHIVDWLWQYAFEQRASDIHVEPRREAGIVRFRIDGVLHQVYQIPVSVLSAMTSRIKLLARMEIVEKRRPQDGRIKTLSPDGEEIELRISTMPTAFGEKIVMRIFTPEVLVRNFRDLGFTDDDEQRWEQMVRQPYGIILVTGPTGSGKTTTLYSTLKHIATPEVNVCTVEDPIEMIEPLFNQMQVEHKINVDFANGVRTLLRQDPDVIMVGEIRDRDTAEMAVQAALTGHLVLSTLHTNDAPSAITRLLDLGVPGYLINSTLLGVMAQRLVRTLCPHCKAPGEAPPDELWQQLTAPWRAERPASVHNAVGCLECRMTGYLGRIGLYEVMLLTPALREMVGATAEHAHLREQAYRDGMKPLRTSGALKIAGGLTTADEVLRAVPLA